MDKDSFNEKKGMERSDNQRLTAEAIAGYCMESAIWRMLRDVATAMQESPRNISAADIVIDDDAFVLNYKDSESWALADPAHAQQNPSKPGSTLAHAQLCSEADAVWSLGAAACLLSSGHPVFGGKGKTYQERHPQVALPVLRREHALLTPLVHACLQADPNRRLTLKQLCEKSAKGYNDCIEREKVRIEAIQEQTDGPKDSLSDLWPEEMR